MNLTIDELVGKSVKVYWNLRKNVFSVQYKGRVVAHVNQIKLDDVTFKVRLGGHKRVLESGRKNVHAFICGTVNWQSNNIDTEEPDGYNLITYNPFVKPFFYYSCNGRKIVDTGFAICWHGGIYV